MSVYGSLDRNLRDRGVHVPIGTTARVVAARQSGNRGTAEGFGWSDAFYREWLRTKREAKARWFAGR